MTAELKQFCKQMPKIELHAHINGSISNATLTKLLKRKHSQDGDNVFEASRAVVEKGDKRSLHECFAMFKLIHTVVTDTKAMYMVTSDVIKDFCDDGVRYLELRSTPRDEPSTGMTKRSYVEAVISAIEDSMKKLPIIVRLLLAIDHRNSVDVAQDTVNLAAEFKQKTGIILGVDLSGDLSASDARQFLPAFFDAQKKDLKLALHLAELPKRNDEVLEMLKLIPDRVGHGTFLQPIRGGNQDIIDIMLKHKIPIELCLTSNIKGSTVPSFDQHHFKFWYEQNHPCVICTDDKGVFATTLTEEFNILAEAFQLTKEQLWELTFNAIDCIFESEAVKQKLKNQFSKDKLHLFEGPV